MFYSLIKKIMPVYNKIIYILVMLLFFSGCVATGPNNGSTVDIKSGMHNDSGKIVKNIARRVKSIDILPCPGAVEVLIKGNSKLTYTSVKQSFPLGIVIYLPETKIDGCNIGNLPGKTAISSVEVSYTDSKKNNAKVEIFLKNNLHYAVSVRKTDLKVMIYDNAAETNEFTRQDIERNHGDMQKKGNSHTSVAYSGNMQQNQSDLGSRPFKNFSAPAKLTGIAFTDREDGSSDVIIKMSHPVKYDFFREKDKNKLILNLYNTDIPKYRRRPFLTEYFRSAVNKIIPVERKRGEKSSHIVIELREAVPYRIVRKGNGLLLCFAPCSIPPKQFTQAEKLLGNNGSNQMHVDSFAENRMAGKNISRQNAASGNEYDLFKPKKVYTGEKIKVDFFETDIKNVFRILASVSKKNLAVDKDVSGNVTLSLDKPVPWDQVLDLVLKMNHLGMVQEGSIIRIATQKTLKQEQAFKQAEFAARKRELAEKRSLEPLVTEYIPINYSNAKTDIKPHLEKILTPKRGRLSVDSRTNMIIMTDTREKIAQAKEIINKLDKVTPQIMIAAKIVEVTKNFSKKLGIDWSMASKDQDGNARAFGTGINGAGGNYGFDLAMNYPVASSGSIGYSFSHITGTPFVLDATLSASEITGDVKIISSPKILTLDNTKAKIKQGLQYPYLERDDSGGSSVKFKDIDLLLEVTPHVTPDKRIALTVHLTKNDVASVTNGVPSLSTNEADTELLVNDGDTIVIGGITKSTVDKSKNGFPGLSSVPILGKLFGSQSKTDNRNELLIFITPTIVQLDQVKKY